MRIPRGNRRTALALAALVLLCAQGAHAAWTTAWLTKDLIAKGEIIGSYRDLWGTGPNNVYAAGAGGIIRFDGKKWNREAATLPANSIFQGLWGSGANDIYAIGHYGLIQTAHGPLAHHFNGRRWVDVSPQLAAAMPPGVSGVGLWKIGGTARNDVYVSGTAVMDDRSAALVLHYDGSSWSPVLLEKNPFIWDLLVRGRDDVYVVGSTTALISPARGATTYGAVRHFTGREWRDLSQAFNPSPGSEFNAVAALGPADIFVVGGGAFFRGDGANWQRIEMAGNVGVQRLLVFDSRLYGNVRLRTGYKFRGASAQLLAYWNNREWRIVPLQEETEPETAWGADGHVFAAGLGPQLFHFDGKGNIEDPAPLDDGRTKKPATVLDF